MIKTPKTVFALVFLAGCVSLIGIGSVEFARFAVAKPASDEGWIAFARDGSIWIMQADGGSERLLTKARDSGPVWSPDGRQITFMRWFEDPGVWEVYVMNADGSNIRRLTGDSASELYSDWDPSWSPDGKQIAVARNIYEKKGGKGERKGSGIYVMDADGSNVKRVGGGPAEDLFTQPAWSPDRRKIAYCRCPANIPGDKWAVWVMDVDGQNRKMLHSQSDGNGLDWSPDGSKIAFTYKEDSSVRHIYVMNADGTNPKKLTRIGKRYFGPVWSPDGTKIAFGAWEEDKQETNVWVMNGDGSNAREITSGCWPSWIASLYAIEPAGRLTTTWGEVKGE